MEESEEEILKKYNNFNDSQCKMYSLVKNLWYLNRLTNYEFLKVLHKICREIETL